MKDKARATVDRAKDQSRRAKVVELAAAALAILGFAVLFANFNEATGPSRFPADGPAEFLYLDSDRVIAYLAQLDGGTFTSETLTHKLTDGANGKVNLQAVEVSGSVSREDSLSRVVTPTAAANYFELLSDLGDLHDGLTRIGLRRFGEDVKGLKEGQFVTFQTHALRPPVYLNPYLALRQRQTVSTLFPMPDDSAGKVQVRTLRHHARDFRAAVGANPRVVFALRPLNTKEEEERRRRRHHEDVEKELVEKEVAVPRRSALKPAANGGTQALPSREEIQKRLLHEEEHVQYLMPLDAQLLTSERSLLKFGGGEFTVVGKVVRIFPEQGDRHNPAYVDSPTTETWAQPLQHAPLALLCRTEPRCTKVIRDGEVDSRKRRRVIERARRSDLEALVEQTEIPDRGAVILPIAIYK